MFRKVLVANRGEIAARVVRTLKRMGIASVAVYSDADRFTPGVLAADEAVRLGPAPAAQSYLDVEAVIAACKATGAEAVHPGYGFLSENVGFAERLAAEGLIFIGPRPEHLRAFGLKHTARDLAKASGVPLLPGTDLLPDVETALSAAEAIGYPVMLKSTAGGGGIGMQLCHSAQELAERFAAVERTARASFGDARVYLERFVAQARHVEVQIFGDGKGRVVALGERDCSLQRRNQKVIEETPAPGLSDTVRARLHAAAVAFGESVAYESAGTVEFIYDPDRADFYVPRGEHAAPGRASGHGAVFGIDLVEWMIRQAAGEDRSASRARLRRGARRSRCGSMPRIRTPISPSAGLLTEVRFRIGRPHRRLDRDRHRGDAVLRSDAGQDHRHRRRRAGGDRGAPSQALADDRNRPASRPISTICAPSPPPTLRQRAGRDHGPARPRLSPAQHRGRLLPGPQSSVQELPGRLGLWHVGVPPSGPMDERSFRACQPLVGNDPTTALELTVSGPTCASTPTPDRRARGRADAASLDGIEPRPQRAVCGDGGPDARHRPDRGAGPARLSRVRGGLAAPLVLGSRATFALGAFGGHATGVAEGRRCAASRRAPAVDADPPRGRQPQTQAWEIGVVYGPHGAPDFFLESRHRNAVLGGSYEVHFNSARTGVRLIGPTPRWARADGGEAGLHPSNLHDNAYAVGSIDFTGDMPIILGPDGPSLGGFVCPAVIARDELWKWASSGPATPCASCR
jgi:urea carboxylase